MCHSWCQDLWLASLEPSLLSAVSSPASCRRPEGKDGQSQLTLGSFQVATSSCLLLPPSASSCLLLPSSASFCIILPPPPASLCLLLPPPVTSSCLLLPSSATSSCNLIQPPPATSSDTGVPSCHVWLVSDRRATTSCAGRARAAGMVEHVEHADCRTCRLLLLRLHRLARPRRDHATGTLPTARPRDHGNDRPIDRSVDWFSLWRNGQAAAVSAAHAREKKLQEKAAAAFAKTNTRRRGFAAAPPPGTFGR